MGRFTPPIALSLSFCLVSSRPFVGFRFVDILPCVRVNSAHGGIDNVFLLNDSRPLTNNSIKLMFARLAKRSGVQRLYAHLYRHTFATMFLTNGGDIFTLQQILGHSTLEMVRHYVNLASNQVAIQHQRFSPLDLVSLGKR